MGGRTVVTYEPLPGATTTGAAGATESTVKVLVLESTLVLPAASLDVAFAVCEPCDRSVVGVKLQAPEAFAVVVPATTPSM